MRVVIDTNRLESEELRIFLRGSEKNFAVLPEHTNAEVFRASRQKAIRSNFSILCQFPRQVLHLWSNQKALIVNPRTSAMANQFINWPDSKAFPAFCSILDMTTKGHLSLERQLAQRRQWAIERAANVQEAFGDMAEALAELRSNFRREDLRAMAAGERIPDRAKGTIYALTLALAQDQLWQAKGWRLPSPPYRYDHFAWRYSLCHVIQMVELLKKGARRRDPEKSRNDHFDNVFATFGTYFNGVMTDDQSALITQHIARIILRSLGSRLAPDYNETEYIRSLLDEE